MKKLLKLLATLLLLAIIITTSCTKNETVPAGQNTLTAPSVDVNNLNRKCLYIKHKLTVDTSVIYFDFYFNNYASRQIYNLDFLFIEFKDSIINNSNLKFATLYTLLYPNQYSRNYKAEITKKNCIYEITAANEITLRENTNSQSNEYLTIKFDNNNRVLNMKIYGYSANTFFSSDTLYTPPISQYALMSFSDTNSFNNTVFWGNYYNEDHTPAYDTAYFKFPNIDFIKKYRIYPYINGSSSGLSRFDVNYKLAESGIFAYADTAAGTNSNSPSFYASTEVFINNINNIHWKMESFFYTGVNDRKMLYGYYKGERYE